ncbi:hypothetical protein FZEAL_5325 [Fusarium zealandicum]|uniref:Archaemetzincin-2 n=1 Tax=Fusarium zealandicum TaxID=1053134 RepID=A0A8H4XKK4_9HYPO|nr:hypothetical protein FZEAL_5325 [Fusarium zealandicum]
MPRSKPSKGSPSSCSHDAVYIGKSPGAIALSYYEPPSQEERLAAATISGKVSSASQIPPLSTFPGVNLIPQDSLDLDPKETGQSLREFAYTRGRNSVTRERRTLYVVDVPQVTAEATAMNTWMKPEIPFELAAGSSSRLVDEDQPQVDDIADYMKAFYHGLEVKLLRNTSRFTTWRNSSINPRPSSDSTSQSRGRVGFVIGGKAHPVQFRTSPDGVAVGQLNLNDMLDALLTVVPIDAFAIILLTHHDLYEDEEDDFCAGRAYGGSRICIASTFRYRPALDNYNNISHAHSWPASHCRAYVDALWEESEPKLKAMKRGKRGQGFDPSSMIRLKDHAQRPLIAAITASQRTLVPKTKADRESVWLARVCRTASHELGHCVGIAHCTYYACTMQSTANMAEDVRQPPYLCPVCLNKVAYSMVGEAVIKSRGTQKEVRRNAVEAQWVVESYQQMQLFCERNNSVGMFGGYRAWLGERLRELEDQEDDHEKGEKMEIIEISDDDD